MGGKNKKFKNGFIEYFDSGGLDSFRLTSQIDNFFKLQKKPIFFNKIKVQDDSSVFCGKFVLVHLFFKANYLSMKKIIQIYKTKDLKKNDDIVSQYFNKIFK